MVPDQVAPQYIDESPRTAERPRPYAQRMAREKAAAAARPGLFVLGADTVVAVGQRILPKAETEAEAAFCLNLLSGRRHHVLSALTLLTPEGHASSRLSETSVTFARLTAAQIRAYLDGGEWQGKAGGYAIQGAAAAFIRAISGSYSGVVGLPLHETAQLLRGRGYLHP